MWIPRKSEQAVIAVTAARPALLLTGIRQAGKSALLKKLFPEAAYITLDKVMTAAYAEENPRDFLEQYQNSSRVILDEIQYAPSLFRELKILIDRDRERYGKWILTGSQKFTLMKNASESLAGRISIIQLETLSASEIRECGFFPQNDELLWKGGFPETWTNPLLNTSLYFEDYIQTYLEKDLRTILQVTSLRDFQRFIRACAVRTGQLVNFTDISKDIGITANTVKAWINTLETSGIIVLLEPYSASLGKRLIKAPKLYFTDQGLLCSLLNISSREHIRGHIHEGQIWENFVFTELLKTEGIRPGKNLFFYRDQNAVEMDFLIEQDNKIILIEAKSAENVKESRLNFHKVSPVFTKFHTECVLASPCIEKTPVKLKNHTVINPLNHGLVLL